MIDFFCIGTTSTLTNYPNLRSLDSVGEDPQTMTHCNKETGEKKKQQKWTRGIWVCTSG